MEYLLVLNDSPHGSQRTYNALRWAGALAKAQPGKSLFSCWATGWSVGCRCNPRQMRPITFRKCYGFWLRKVSQSAPAALVWRRVGLMMPRSSLASTAAPWTICAIGQRKQRKCWCFDPPSGGQLSQLAKYPVYINIRVAPVGIIAGYVHNHASPAPEHPSSAQTASNYPQRTKTIHHERYRISPSCILMFACWWRLLLSSCRNGQRPHLCPLPGAGCCATRREVPSLALRSR